MTAIVGFMVDGGPFMWVLLTISVLMMFFAIERAYALWFRYDYDFKFFQMLLNFVRIDDYYSAARICQSSNHPLAKVVLIFLANKDRPHEEIEDSVSLVYQKLSPQVTERSVFIQMLANVATLVGLLGTIQGLIVAFTSLDGASAANKASILAKGISTAMNTTFAGLAIAIPGIILYTIITNKENKVLGRYEETISELMEIHKAKFRRLVQKKRREKAHAEGEKAS